MHQGFQKPARLFFALLAPSLIQTSFANQEQLATPQVKTESEMRSRKFEFLNCQDTATVEGATVTQWLSVFLITDASLNPISIEGSYAYNNQTEGIHASASLSGHIKGKYVEESNAYTSIVLRDGKLQINAEGDIQEERLLSVGYNSAKTGADFYATVGGPFGRDRLTRLEGCQVKNLGLVAKILDR